MTTTSYQNSDPVIGVAPFNGVYVQAALGYPWTSSTNNPLPAVPIEQLFGQITQGHWADSTSGGSGEFIFLRVPASTTITAGLLYSWGDAGSGWDVTALPTSSGTTTTSGAPICVAVNSVASSTSVQATWFQVQGRCTVLKDAVKMAPGAPVYFSKSAAGRVRVVGSAFYGIIGMRSATLTTITTTTSSALMYLNRPNLTVAI
ncbi:MAG TPA: hypothetical protein VG892_07565 [Terriglobales bacterium]|nr:hypothetical protein [Terriglobales bacterium]